MIRIRVSTKITKANKLVQGRLSTFNLDLDKDIVSTIMNGASVMMKFGKDTSPLQTAC